MGLIAGVDATPSRAAAVAGGYGRLWPPVGRVGFGVASRRPGGQQTGEVDVADDGQAAMLAIVPS
jgi:hypothetical protein